MLVMLNEEKNMDQKENKISKEIFKTKDYSIFSLMQENRERNEHYVGLMKRSLQQKNLLSKFPIIVDRNYVIKDGQNRFWAAKELGVDLFYEFDEDLQLEDVVLLAATRKNWSLKDYLHAYVARNYPEYVYLNLILNKFPSIDLTILLQILTKGESARERFKSGKLKIEISKYEIEKILKQIEATKKHFYSFSLKSKRELRFVESRAFAKGLASFLKIPNVNFEHFLGRLKVGEEKIFPTCAWYHYVKQFIAVYNYNSRKYIITKEQIEGENNG